MILGGGSQLPEPGKVGNRQIVEPHNIIKSPHQK